PLPSQVRPPSILMKTLNYIINNIIDQLPQSNNFIWDRTRAIRKDFTYQNYHGIETIICTEKIVRIHLFTLHIMSKNPDIKYEQQQEIEQLNNSLQSLLGFYDDFRDKKLKLPFPESEAEFRAYYLITQLRDPTLDREIQNLPNEIFYSKHIQLALLFRKLASYNNTDSKMYFNSENSLNLFTKFFESVYSNDVPFLLACALETKFNEIRFYALNSIFKCFHPRGTTSLRILLNPLGFDNIDLLIQFLNNYKINI
ncbi:Sac3p, partial [Ascoidea rubescens DSM 1968]